MSTCRTCRRWFDDYGQVWRTYCPGCYAARKRAEEREAELHEDGTVDRAYRLGYRAGKRDALEVSPRVTFCPDLVRRAIRLTHPDRHPAERADEANNVTASLLNLIEGGRR